MNLKDSKNYNKNQQDKSKKQKQKYDANRAASHAQPPAKAVSVRLEHTLQLSSTCCPLTCVNDAIVAALLGCLCLQTVFRLA